MVSRYGPRAVIVVLLCLTGGCAAGPRPILTPHTAQIPHLGINTGPDWVINTPFWLDFLASQPRPLTVRIPVLSAASAKAVLDALRPYPRLSVLLLIESPDLALATALGQIGDAPQLTAIECGNELDLFGLTPRQFADFTAACARAILPRQVITGGIYTVDEESLAYAAPMLASTPCDVVFGVHLYQDSGDDTLARLQQAAGCHAIAVTEYGMPARTPDEERAQAAYLAEKATAFARLGARFAILYRLGDGPCGAPDPVEHMGIFRCDATPKRAAFDVFR